MTKKIAVINDLSGFGRCSLTAAISVISAMGVSPCPLPTALLSAQTGYPSYYLDDYTDKMEYFREEWEKMGASFDGIYTGFVASEAQLYQISRFLNTFKNNKNFLLVDPVMGDDGKTYAMFTPRLLALMKELALKADIITPNLTELCLLTDTDYCCITSNQNHDVMIERILNLASSLCRQGPEHIVVTGIHFDHETDGRQMGNLYVTKTTHSLISFPYVGGSYSGTGDLFASCLAAGIARGDSIPHTIQIAGEFIQLALADSVRENINRNAGVNYEKYLNLLLPACL